MEEAALGSKVHDTREEGGVWRVVGLDEGAISLSGPIPCRGMKIVEHGEFEEFWEEVE